MIMRNQEKKNETRAVVDCDVKFRILIVLLSPGIENLQVMAAASHQKVPNSPRMPSKLMQHVLLRDTTQRLMHAIRMLKKRETAATHWP